MKTFLLLLLMLLVIGTGYFSYFYNPTVLWVIAGLEIIAIVSFILISKKEDKKEKEYNNRSIYYNNNK